MLALRSHPFPMLEGFLMDAVVNLAVFLAATATQADPTIDFARDVAPVLERRCLACHNAAEKKGGLSLETAATALAGGESGSILSPGKPEASAIVDLITPRNGKAEMPKDADPLSDREVAAIRTWIAAGANWPKDVVLRESRLASTDWWSLKQLRSPPVPQLDPPPANPIDAFVHAKLAERQMTPSPEADRRTLIRRLSFDLLGLPPSPAEVEAFVNDSQPRAYERLVDRLLASPHYGERWARHWLDVVHFGETHGYDKDKPRPNAWPYRDYVIRAFNADKPYARFVEEQIAGDVLYPGTVDGIEALGFLAAGPWDFIGHAEVPESKIDGKIARHLDRDDMVANTIGTFNSLTVGCAQCHSHKFDPISQEDYYRLQAVFAAIDRADKRYHADPAVTRQVAELESRQQSRTARKQQLDEQIKKLGGELLADLDRRIQAASQPDPKGQRPEFGYHSQIMPRADAVKWVQVDLGESRAIQRIVYAGCHDTFNNIGAGFGFPVRFRIELSDDPEFKTGVVPVVDQTAADFPNPGTAPQSADVGGKRARYVRVTATKLALRQNDYIFALAELLVLDADGQNLATGKTVTAPDSIEAVPRWRKQNLVDGIYPGVSTAAAEQLPKLKQQRDELLAKSVDAATRDEWTAVTRELSEITAALAKLPPANVVYAGTVHFGSGTFSGTGGKPRPIFLLARGDVTKPGRPVGPGSLSALTGLGLPSEFPLDADRPESDRRAALAKWLSDSRNPLTWRSIVNRVWQYHFGRGLVDTPNDFGRMGQLPSHPELLDFLAAEFRDGNQSLKGLHRRIVTSATYRQSSADRLDYAKRDANNSLLWRANRRKLEAEAVRDAVLFVAGKLDPKPGGPSFQDFVIDQPAHSPHYEYHLHDPNDPRTWRRSVYRFLVRSQPQPFMTTLDCADPSMRVDKRNESLSALQALALLNNGFMVTMSKHFAARVAAEGGDVPSQIDRAVRLALGRSPTPAERETLVALAERHSLANVCRTLINLNEFAFVD